MSLYLGDKLISGSFKSGASWEVGDVGISALGIDESLNKRRYLNGQVISQTQFVQFTAFLKSRVSVYPSLATTEVNWQAAVTNSDLGQCGQFVIDDDAGTIRLPKVVNIQGLIDLTGLGTTEEAGLPNITGKYTTGSWIKVDPVTGAYSITSRNNETGGSSGSDTNFQRAYINFSAQNSNPIYGNSTTVQPESVQYPYFIQVAEGIENSVDVSREIELNNPFSLLDYKYSEYELSNASWLLSNGQWNSGAVYQSVYNLLLQIYNRTVTKAGVSVKLSTETYADTDFVLNTSDTTFRLPIKVLMAGSKRVAGNGMTLGMTNGTINGGLTGSTNSGATLLVDSTYYGAQVQGSIRTLNGTGGTFGITTDETKSGIETSANGLYLYFYVGEVVQDANIIAAGQVLTDIADLKNLSNLSPLGQKVIDGQWVSDRLVVATGVAYTTTHTSYSLSTYLPNDNYQYEVLFQVGNTNTTAVNIETDLGFSTGVRSASTVQLYNSFTLPVGTGRSIEAYTTSGTSSGSVIVAIGYRRIGTNS